MASFLSRLFGGAKDDAGEAAPAEPETYKGFTIVPAPMPNGGQFNTAGTITKEIDGEMKEHKFIRADTHAGRDEAVRHSLTKARQIIDEQGDRLFG
jgi:hypothetical protein